MGERTVILALGLGLIACGHGRPPLEPGAAPPGGLAAAILTVPLGADAEAAARGVARRAQGVEVVYLGELHDNPAAHAAQDQVLRAILAAGGRPAVAFEMVAEGDQEELERTVRSGDLQAEVERRLRWHQRGWPDFAMYWPLLELARRHSLPVVGTDLDPAVTRRVSRAGLGAVGDRAGRLISALPADPERDRAIGRRIQAAHCHLLPDTRVPPMVESWYARNVTIARRLADALQLASQVVVIIGRGHQSQGGVPAQLLALRPGTRQLVVSLVEVGPGRLEPQPDSMSGLDVADVVWLIPGLERPDPCRGLRQHLGGLIMPPPEALVACPGRAQRSTSGLSWTDCWAAALGDSVVPV